MHLDIDCNLTPLIEINYLAERNAHVLALGCLGWQKFGLINILSGKQRRIYTPCVRLDTGKLVLQERSDVDVIDWPIPIPINSQRNFCF